MSGDQRLMQVTSTCVRGIATQREEGHAACENTTCECFCHHNGYYPRSWHRDRPPRLGPGDKAE